ncbi:MAG: hypothetical protein WCA19_00770 [Candidatus Acidiferrales bacterium]
MNFGFNSNVRVGEAVFHVQTEDRGPSHPFLDTVVYMAGRVVYKRSTNYEKFVHGMEPGSLAQKLHERLSQQHHEVIAELEGETLPFQSKAKALPAADNVAASDSLDLRLTNPKSWLVAGHVTLEVELCEKNSEQAVADADVRASLEHENHRTLCAEVHTDVDGCATLTFPMPANVAEGSSLVVSATDGSRHGELRFRLKSRPREKTPAPVSQ